MSAVEDEILADDSSLDDDRAQAQRILARSHDEAVAIVADYIRDCRFFVQDDIRLHRENEELRRKLDAIRAALDCVSGLAGV